jgi:hypothetical protein
LIPALNLTLFSLKRQKFEKFTLSAGGHQRAQAKLGAMANAERLRGPWA